MMPTFMNALRTRLKNLPALATLHDVYTNESPPEAIFPFLVIDPLYGDDQINVTDDYYSEVAYQFTVYATDSVQAQTLSEAARRALWPKASNPPIVFDGGYQLDGGRYPGQMRGPNTIAQSRPEGNPLIQMSFDYTFLIGKSMSDD